MGKKEKYYICPICAELVTESERLKSAENSGANGMCYCPFTEPFWNEVIDELDVQTPREFQAYTEISKR